MIGKGIHTPESRSYRVLVFLSDSSTQQYIEYQLHNVKQMNTSTNYYYFLTQEGKSRYYPISRTVIIEI